VRFVRRLAAVTALSAAAFGATGLLAAPAASAHPLGNFTINHYDGLMISPGHVRVTYVLDMAEIPTFQQMPSIDANGDGTATPAERQAWAARQARSLAPLLVLTVDGRPVGLSVDCSPSMVFRPGQGGLSILRMVATLDGTLPGSVALAFRDGTYAARIGWK